MQILLTGGIGDIFALESNLTESQRSRLSKIYWGCRCSPEMIDLWSSLPNYPNLVGHEQVWTDFAEVFAIIHKGHAEKLSGRKLPTEVEDWSILHKFCDQSFANTFNGSSFLKTRLASIDHLQLPEKYVFVQAYTPVNRPSHRMVRDFQPLDWENLLSLLRKRDLKGVVVNQGNDPVPSDSNLVDLSNRTTLREAVEVLKRASGFIGIDSCFSILASQLFSADKLVIRARNEHLYTYKHCYYAKHRTFPFLCRTIPPV